MSLSALAVRRPVATTMVFAAVVALGWMSFLRLQVDLLPKLDFPSLNVLVEYPGVAPEDMETLITRPLEEAVARVENVDRIESFSTEGRSRVALRFDWGVPLETALNDARAAVERARMILPEEAGTPVVYKFDLSNLPILSVALEAPGMQEGALRRFAEDVVRPRLERVSGVASIEVRGARLREVRIALDPLAMRALGISVGDLLTALRGANVAVPAGPVEDGEENLLVRAMSEFTSMADMEQTLVVQRGRHAVRLRDVARVEDDFEDVVNLVRIDGTPSVQLRITKSPDANTLEVTDRLYRELERFNVDFEGRAALRTVVDSSVYIRRSVEDVQSSMALGAGLAVLILMVFLRSLGATLVVATALPISVMGTFFLLEQLELTLNLISFGGLALGLGMLVDNAIVILENIYRRRQQGDDATQAAVVGAEEVAGAIVASTLTTLAVFAPVPFLTGFSGVFFEQMALVVSSALACSLLVALTLVPVLCSRLLRARGAGAARPDAAWQRGLDSAYGWLLDGALRRRWLVALVALGLLAGAWRLVDQVGTELLPESDESEVSVSLDYPAGTRIEVTTAAVERVEALVRAQVPEATSVLSSVGTPGFWSSSGEESANLTLTLVPPGARTRSSAQVAAAVQGLLVQELPGMRVRCRASSGLWVFSFIRGGDTRLRVDVRGFDLEDGDRLAARVMEEMRQVEGVLDVRPSRLTGGRELRLHVDRDQAATLGVRVADVAETVSTLVQGSRVGVWRERGEEIGLRVRLPEEALRSAHEVLALPFRLPSGAWVPLSALVTRADGRTPLSIDRLNQERVVNLTGNVSPDRDLGSMQRELRGRLQAMQGEVPEGFSVVIAGEAEEQKGAFGSLGLGILLALALVYMVMAGQFESFVQPLVIMASVPFAAVGVVATLVWTGTTFNLNSFMGAIVLVGVVVNNAIVLVDYANLLQRRDGYALREAVLEGSRRRLRPILMTTLTTVLALLPVAVGWGSGSETQTPLARVVVGGLTCSTLVTLFVVPSLYLTVEGWRSRRLRGAASGEVGDGEVVVGEEG
jgi:HAE1 family hydrophobic/amphiphilic exporter-1